MEPETVNQVIVLGLACILFTFVTILVKTYKLARGICTLCKRPSTRSTQFPFLTKEALGRKLQAWRSDTVTKKLNCSKVIKKK